MREMARQEREERRREEREDKQRERDEKQRDRDRLIQATTQQTQMNHQVTLGVLARMMTMGGGGQAALGQPPHWAPPAGGGGGDQASLVLQPPNVQAPHMPFTMPPHGPVPLAPHAPGGGAPGPQAHASWYPGTNSGGMSHGEDDESDDLDSGRPPSPPRYRPPTPPLRRRSPRGHENKGRET